LVARSATAGGAGKRFLHVRSNQPEIGNLCVAFLREPLKFVAEAAGETLRLAPGELERRVFGRMPVSHW
jgi:hypothetical protein